MAEIWILGMGYVGTPLAKQLAQAGHQVTGFRRRPLPPMPGVTTVEKDLGELHTYLSTSPLPPEWVYFLAAPGRQEDGYQKLYHQTLPHTLQTLSTFSPELKRFFLVTSTRPFPDLGETWQDENSPTKADDAPSQCLLDAEAEAQNCRLPTTCIRFSGIYGPERNPMARSLRAGDPIAHPWAWTNRIHQQDCVGFLSHLLSLNAPSALYIATDNTPIQRINLLQALAHHHGYPEPTAGAGENKGKRLSNQRLLQSGYQLQYPSWREGYHIL
jgi:nucleoside-diphosphate-sugar epimerase